MSYNTVALYAEINARLERTPDATLKQLCHELAIDRQTASAVIRHATGKCFRVWIREQRLQKASGLLRTHPTMTIAEVARACGFGSVQAFDRFCRKNFGVCPSRLRRGGC
jgi:AraC-like DNA-binding protein